MDSEHGEVSPALQERPTGDTSSKPPKNKAVPWGTVVPSPLRALNSPMATSYSEEERQRRARAKRAVLASVLNVDELPVIEISSDEEDASSAPAVARKGASQSAGDPQGRESGDPEGDEGDNAVPLATPPRGKHKPLQTPCSRRVVLSSDSEGEEPRTPAPVRRRLPLDDDIIDLTVSSPEPDPPKARVPGPPRTSGDVQHGSRNEEASSAEASQSVIPLFVDDSDDDDADTVPDDPFDVDDGSILVLNEPRSARKPVRRPGAPKLPAHEGGAGTPFTPSPLGRDIVEGGSDSESDAEDGGALDSPGPKPPHKPLLSNARPAAPSPRPTKARAPRMTKKALLQAELARRREYAAAFFKELNESVFGGGIPEGTELVWSKRLLTTAGRAHWKRDRNGVNITSIQLAEKVLDCDERIRNTLSHEMCHLACWIISNAPDEQHGSLFKGWAQKVMRKRSDVQVTTRHDYEISHKYKWKCEACAKIYGRHSKSINPDEVVCGVCQGRLVPQFESRPRAPKTPKPKADSQNAATRSRDSPLVMPGAFPASPAVKTQEAGSKDRVTIEIFEDSDDSDIEILAHTLENVRIADAARP